MADLENFKKRIKEMILQEINLEFYGADMDEIILSMNESQETKIYEWARRVKDSEEKMIRNPSSNINYKQWQVKDLILFRYAFNINNIEYRISLLKVKNRNFIEFHLGKHDYYDKIRKDFGLKKTSY